MGRQPVSVDALTELTGASPATVRRDLADLEGQGQLRRVHGGALATNRRGTPLPYDLRAAEHADEKERLARVVAGLIEPDSSLILDNGSTIVVVAAALADTPVTALCLSLRSAIALADRGQATVATPGGTVTPPSLRYDTGSSLAALNAFRADVAVIGTCAANAAHGLSVTTHADAQVKRAILATTSRVILAATADKLSRTSSFRFGTLEDIDDLVTTADASEDVLADFAAAGVQVHTC